jgi:hypothetical protein
VAAEPDNRKPSKGTPPPAENRPDDAAERRRREVLETLLKVLRGQRADGS